MFLMLSVTSVFHVMTSKSVCSENGLLQEVTKNAYQNDKLEITQITGQIRSELTLINMGPNVSFDSGKVENVFIICI